MAPAARAPEMRALSTSRHPRSANGENLNLLTILRQQGPAPTQFRVLQPLVTLWQRFDRCAAIGITEIGALRAKRDRVICGHLL